MKHVSLLVFGVPLASLTKRRMKRRTGTVPAVKAFFRFSKITICGSGHKKNKNGAKGRLLC